VIRTTASSQVVVSLNYRLGPLGFPVFQGAGKAIEGNFGIEDQREALRWVQKEVGACAVCSPHAPPFEVLHFCNMTRGI
jgi:hypothetical protein